ncbi:MULTISPECIES: type II toxin-antitoxin system PemK/MazF family toxin [unclassified Brevibacterium]|uniref:type II toxin-antitoxin system PemK/MazF family toxin n=1 Tax=unclassified Brevibacterium TaxID=2614124 RepID=UPI001E284607|nr:MULTISPECIES: type II toxin-antitoxin system PemK/MazF family toxin [unclassified Brevibacterium]MCD1285048.1 growth inhibitor PemK [Brevibacterium sp. CCUG 69071]MDK8435329.1 type II toxin-antitoxin system PemK/MazF family toxin [Brevibacterium sp. H-BE7]
MSWKSLVNRAVRIGVREGVRYLKDAKAKNDSGPSRDTPREGGPHPRPGSDSPADSGSRRQSPAPQQSGTGAGAYPGDYRGSISVSYSPDLDGDADPGEVVWGWIPYEEDHSQGKDRPSLVVGRDGRWVLVLMLTSKDHIPGGFGEVREDRNAKWMNIGSGDWDSQGRPSEIRLDRVIRVDPNSIRREGAIMPREVFEKVAANIES